MIDKERVWVVLSASVWMGDIVPVSAYEIIYSLVYSLAKIDYNCRKSMLKYDKSTSFSAHGSVTDFFLEWRTQLLNPTNVCHSVLSNWHIS